MTKKLFKGTTNGLELWVVEQVLEKLRLEHQNKLEGRLMPDGKIIGRGKLIVSPDQTIQAIIDSLFLEGDCWVWSKSVTKGKQGGYGATRINGQPMRIHRLIYLLTRGAFEHPCVCHHCDNRPCANPDHLFNGTSQMNVTDREIKGRGVRQTGVFHHSSKFTSEEVIGIRKFHQPYDATFGTSALARKFNVTKSTIKFILNGKTWRHLLPQPPQPHLSP